jgi:leader peptidase (prepilin peptidase) / N-methyltransferase
MDDSLLVVMSAWPFGVMLLLVGLCIGSFLNVCIYRLPAGGSIVSPPSHCMACSAPIAWYDNIPVLSYFLLRGRCRKCGATYSARYMLVELATGLLWFGYWLAYFRFHVREGADHGGVYLVHMILVSALLASGIIDFDRKEIYTAVTNVALGAGLVGSMLWPRVQMIGAFDLLLSPRTGFEATDALLMSLVGAAVGAGLINVTRYLGTLVFRKEAMGGGDAYLMAAIGAVLGWEAAVLVFFIAPFIGLPLGVWQIVRMRREALSTGSGRAPPAAVSATKEPEDLPPPVLHHTTFLATAMGLAGLVAAAFLGAHGWSLGARVTLLGSLIAFGASGLSLHREQEPPRADEGEAPAPGESHEIPYGPSLGAAAGLVMLLQDPAIRYLSPGFENMWKMLVG